MARRGQTTAQPVIGPANDPASLYYQMQPFLQWMLTMHYSTATVANREDYLRYFITWCDDRGLARPTEITRPILERYQRYLFLYRKKDGQPLSNRSQSTRMVPIRAWFKWLTKNNRLLYNPASDLDMPRMERRLPRHILSEQEADQVLNVPDTSTDLGVRDRAMLETLYSTGMRRMELIGLSVFDLDFERGTVMVRQGKGKRDRMIPIGERALAWILKYRDQVRPQFALADDAKGGSEGGHSATLFLTQQGEAFTPNRLTQLVRTIINAAGIHKKGSCHLFRHTMATLMLENGADIRFIQAMLGHAELSTTQIYTQVSIVKLKQIHTLTHPARLARLANASDACIDDATGAQMSEATPTPQSEPEDPAAALLAALDAEGDEETE
jgi:integrase/recombinase XerD